MTDETTPTETVEEPVNPSPVPEPTPDEPESNDAAESAPVTQAELDSVDGTWKVLVATYQEPASGKHVVDLDLSANPDSTVVRVNGRAVYEG